MPDIDRRAFLGLAGLGGVVFASGIAGGTSAALAAGNDFFFVQLSDTHWGFSGPPNPEAANTLKKAIAAVNALPKPPDFVVFTGDLTHTTDDAQERRKRMREVKEIIGELKVKDVRFLAGEHDASLDKGEAYKEFFGSLNYTFDHKGVHFIALDNVSDPTGSLGEAQIAWLKSDLAHHDKKAPIVVFAHRPLFDLYPQWDWATKDGAAAIDALMPYENVTVFYGHIHREEHNTTGHIPHHAATSLIFPLPAPGSVPKRAPVAWDPAKPFNGLGWRSIDVTGVPKQAAYKLTQKPVVA
jgi:3',5'-cyclic AMP phosphodiesterase CpdA